MHCLAIIHDFLLIEFPRECLIIISTFSKQKPVAKCFIIPRRAIKIAKQQGEMCYIGKPWYSQKME